MYFDEIEDLEQFLEKEKEQENFAVSFVYGVNFSDCLRINNVETEIKVDGKSIYAHKVYGAWEKFLIAIGETSGSKIEKVTRKTKKGEVEKEVEVFTAKKMVRYTGVTESLKKKMYNWITTEYSASYQSIATDEEIKWLEDVIHFTVYRRIMEEKYNKWIRTGRGFADPDVGKKIAEIYRFRYEIPYVARLIQSKIEKHADHETEEWEKKLARDIITGVFDLLRVDRLRLLPPVDPEMPQLEEGEGA